MGFSTMFTFQLDNTKRWHCRHTIAVINGSCRYVWAMMLVWLTPFITLLYSTREGKVIKKSNCDYDITKDKQIPSFSIFFLQNNYFLDFP